MRRSYSRAPATATGSRTQRENATGPRVQPVSSGLAVVKAAASAGAFGLALAALPDARGIALGLVLVGLVEAPALLGCTGWSRPC